MNAEPSAIGVKPTAVRYEVLGWACALSMITYIDRVCIKNLRPDMQSDLGISDEQFGYVFSAFALSYSLFEVPSGWMGDRFGPRIVLSRIVIWWSLFTALTGLVYPFSWTLGFFVFDTLALLILIRFLFGMGEAGAYPNIARALRNWFPFAQRGKAQGLLWMFGRWGGGFAPLLITLFASNFGWRGAFIAFGVMGILWVVAFVYFFRNTPEEHPRSNEAEVAFIRGGGAELAKPAPISWKNMLKSPTLWCLSLMYFCSNAGWSFLITWDVKYYSTVLKLEGFSLSFASGAALFCGGIGCILGGFFTDRQVRLWGRRWGRTAQGVAAYFLAGALFLAAMWNPHPVWSVVLICLASFIKDLAMAASWSTCIDIGHRYSGSVAGFMNMVGNLGTVFSPPIVEAMAKRGDWNQALLYSGCMFFAASFGWFFVNPKIVIVYSPEDHTRLQREGLLNP